MTRILWAALWFILGAISILALLYARGAIHPSVGIGSPDFLN